MQTFDDNSGVQLSPTANEMAPSAYTIVVLFESRHEGFVRLIDFKNGTADTGLYSQEGLSFYNLAAGAGHDRQHVRPGGADPGRGRHRLGLRGRRSAVHLHRHGPAKP